MSDYPPVVGTIVQDYLDRVTAQLKLLPERDRLEFLREIGSHIYEAYQQEAGNDDVVRILAVLRRLGEPHEVVAGRLPESMVTAGRDRKFPFYILGGILIALFGVPLGFGGVAVLIGVLIALAGVVAAYYITAASMVLVGVIFAFLGAIRLFLPNLWDQLIVNDFIHLEGQVGAFFGILSPSLQGLLMLLFAAIFGFGGVGMAWLGRFLLRGLRFLFNLFLDWLKRIGPTVRGWFRPRNEKPDYARFAKSA